MKQKFLTICLVLFIGQTDCLSIIDNLPKLPSFSNVSLPSLPIPELPKLPTIASPFDSGEKCYISLGCFKRFPPSSLLLKLVDLAAAGLYPSSPEDIDVTFYLYSCSSRYRPHVLLWNSSDDQVRESPYDSSKRTIFIVHGFQDNYDEMNWMGDMKDHILNIDNHVDISEGFCDKNVVAVDWSGGSKTPFYPQAVANTPVVGAVIARFIKQLIWLNLAKSPDDFSVVGHSLGSHISGFVGEAFNETKIRNIIGLDPAGPAFTDVPETHRLDPSDAKLVLTIHTNGGNIVGDYFGIVTPLGHYAFYPNGGGQQPGCEKTHAVTNILMDGIIAGLTDTVACSHRRATLLVQVNETLLTTAHSMAYSCDSYRAFVKGRCGAVEHNPVPFGSWFSWWQKHSLPDDWSEPIRYFIDTTEMKPFAMFHLQLLVLTKQADAFAPFRGYIKLTLIGDRRDGEQIKIDPGTVKPNTTYTYLIKYPKDLGLIKKALVRIKKDQLTKLITSAVGLDGEDYNPTHVIENVKINFMSHANVGTRDSRSTKLMPTSRTEVYRVKKVGYVFVPQE